jgi:hypothetical protein
MGRKTRRSSRARDLRTCAALGAYTAGLLIGLDLTSTNLLKIEAEGIDLAARYAFSLGENRFSIALQATQQRTLNSRVGRDRVRRLSERTS